MHEREGRLLVKLRVDLSEILDDALSHCLIGLAARSRWTASSALFP